MTAQNPSFERILQAIRTICPDEAQMYPLHEPTFRGSEWDELKRCIDSGWVSSAGPFITRFEHMLAERLGSRHVIAVGTGTAALHVSLLVADVHRDDEVIVPPVTFIATANAVAYCGALPHFVDVEDASLGMDPDALAQHLRATTERRAEGLINTRTGRRISAIIPVHIFGHAVRIDEICAVAAEFEIPVVEDAAEGLGTLFRERHVGTFGLLGTLSFNGNKIVTTGGGGAVCTDDAELAKKVRHLSTTARIPHPFKYEHDQVGYNYRMPNLNAALGIAQLGKLDEFVAAKRSLRAAYASAFAEIPEVELLEEPENSRSNYWLQAIRLKNPAAGDRDALLEYLLANKIGARPLWSTLHKLPMFSECPRSSLSRAEALESSIVNIPSSSHLMR